MTNELELQDEWAILEVLGYRRVAGCISTVRLGGVSMLQVDVPSEFEDEFLAHIVLPDGSTAGKWLRPQIAEAYRTGHMPPMLPELGTGS